MNEELAQCARMNFENLARMCPAVAKHVFYRIAKAQLDEALGGKAMEESLAPRKEIGTAEHREDGSIVVTGAIEKVTRD